MHPAFFFNLLSCGIIPIWAHPERCADIIKNYKMLFSYTDNGVLLQVNAGSLVGFYGRKTRETSKMLVKKGLAHILASDTHRGNVKIPLPEAFSSLVKMVGKTKAVEIVFSTPSKVIN
jgi:protein-tyrosine phosphatase